MLLSTQFVKVSANSGDDDSEYDDGFELQDIQDQKSEKQEPSPVEIKKNHPKKTETLIPNENLKIVEKKLTSNVAVYIPIGIIAAIALNVIVISAVMMMKRRRAQVVYSKMNAAKEEVAFELQETDSKI